MLKYESEFLDRLDREYKEYYDFYYSIQVVTMVIVGGMGSLWGSLFGAAILTSISEALHIAKQYHVIAYGLFLCLVLIFLPEGILVGLSRFIQKLRTWRRLPPVNGF